MTYILFGLPGCGKTYIGRIFKKYFGYYLYDGDQDLPIEMKQIIDAHGLVTDKLRDSFFQRISDRIKELNSKHKKLVIAQTYIKEKYRKKVLDEFPEARFILVQTDSKLRENRLAHRVEFPLDAEYARKMCLFFDPPKIPHTVISNNIEGEEDVKKQIMSILHTY